MKNVRMIIVKNDDYQPILDDLAKKGTKVWNETEKFYFNLNWCGVLRINFYYGICRCYCCIIFICCYDVRY